MKPCKEVDVAIIGAGVTGLALARLLAPLGQSIHIYDIRPGITQATRTIALSESSVRIFKNLQLWEAIEPHITPIQSVEISQQGHFGLSLMKHEEMGGSAFGFVIVLSELESILQSSLLPYPNVTIHYATKLKSIEKLEVGYKLLVNADVANKEGETHQEELQTKLLVGADGVNSLVRQVLNLEMTSFTYEHQALAFNIELRHPHHNRAYERYLDDGVLAFLPFGPKSGTVVSSLPRQLIKDLKENDNQNKMAYPNVHGYQNDILVWLDHHFGERLGRILSMTPPMIYPLSHHFANQQVAPSALLVGNAAHIFHPIAAQGFNLTLRDLGRFVELYTAYPNDLELALKLYNDNRADQNQIREMTDMLAKIGENRMIPKTAMGLGMLGFALMPGLLQYTAKIGMGLGQLQPKIARTPIGLVNTLGDKE